MLNHLVYIKYGLQIGHSITATLIGIVAIYIFIKGIFKYAFMTLGIVANLFLTLLMLPFTALAEAMPSRSEKSYVGQTDYNTKTIYIENGLFEEKVITLKHELVHVWLYEMGYTYQGTELCFCVEDVCEISAFSNDFINFVTNKYIKYVKDK